MIPHCILVIEDESDREYMTVLYYQYRNLMYSTTQKILKDPWLVDDAVQTSLERLIDKIQLLRTLDKKRLVNYIVSTCKNNAYNLYRYNYYHQGFSFDETYDTQTELSYEDLYAEKILVYEKLELLIEIWPKLDSRSRYLLEARYILDKSYNEIAENLGIKVASARMALTRARSEAYKLMIEKIEA